MVESEVGACVLVKTRLLLTHVSAPGLSQANIWELGTSLVAGEAMKLHTLHKRLFTMHCETVQRNHQCHTTRIMAVTTQDGHAQCCAESVQWFYDVVTVVAEASSASVSLFSSLFKSLGSLSLSQRFCLAVLFLRSIVLHCSSLMEVGRHGVGKVV